MNQQRPKSEYDLAASDLAGAAWRLAAFSAIMATALYLFGVEITVASVSDCVVTGLGWTVLVNHTRMNCVFKAMEGTR